MKKIIFILVLMSSAVRADDNVLSHYNKITEKCSEGKSNFQDQLVELDNKIKKSFEGLSKEKIEKLFRAENILADIYSYLGSEVIEDESNLRGLKACGNYYSKFLKLYREKSLNESEAVFGEWESCLFSDFKEQIPEIAKRVIDCYNSRSPSNSK